MFCGSAGAIDKDYFGPNGSWYVQQDRYGCGACDIWFDTLEEWNRRADSKLAEALEHCREDLETVARLILENGYTIPNSAILRMISVTLKQTEIGTND